MEYTFTVNGILRITNEDKPLLRYLRDDLKLYSVKDGCSEGACGTCTIIVDGRAVKSCALTTKRAVGKSITTVEGLSIEEKEAFVYAFGSSGSVQCGFCIPGMVMCGKALIDRNPNPTEEEIKEAIRGNICRCTGYKKIIEGIKKTAAILRGDAEIGGLETSEEYGVGVGVFRVDVRRKTLGYGKYPDDIGPEFFVPCDQPERLIEMAGWNEEEVEEARVAYENLAAERETGTSEAVSVAERETGTSEAVSVADSSVNLRNVLRPGMNIFRKDEDSCEACTIVDAGMPPMAYVSAVRSKYPRAIVKKIDKTAAESLPGVLGILTAEDVPCNKVGHIQFDWDVMIAEGCTTRMVGDAICLVVAESEYILEKAKKMVKVEYEILEPVRDIFEARAEGAPKVHESGNLCQQRHVTRGDAKKALAEAAYTATASFHTPFTEHAFLEPECAVSMPYKNGVKILTADQGSYDTRREVLHMFGWDDEPDRVVVENQIVGGGFGGKEDVTTQHISALAAYKFQRPIKAKFSRAESLRVHPKRHSMDGTFTIGCDENGILTALDCEINFDTGAYASLCGPVLERACTHSVGPYQYQNTDIRGFGYYTNNPPAGAFRGFGVCQSEFALESLLNVLAKKVGISPWEIRYRNAIEPGKVLPNGQIADCSTALKETLEAVKPYYDANADHAGISCAMKNAGVGVGLPDKGRAKIIIKDGLVYIYCVASEIGQGCLTVFCQMVGEATGLNRSRIRHGKSTTENAPDSGTTSGSRQTLVTGEAVRAASFMLRKAMIQVDRAIEAGESGEAVGTASASDVLIGARNASDAPNVADSLGIPMVINGAGDGSEQFTDTSSLGIEIKDPIRAVEALEGREFYYEYFDPTDKLGSDKPNPKSHIAYGYATNVVVLDDAGRVSDIYAAYDAGKVINPISIQGQIEGGVLMSMGYALTEDWPLKDGVPQARYGTLGLLRSTDIPDIHAIYVEKAELLGVAYGAKGIGEITTIPAAPAIAGAYYARDGVLRTSLPLENTYYSKRKNRE